jgi:CRP-like cAMP-binding protein
VIVNDDRYRDLVHFFDEADFIMHEAGMPPIHTPPASLKALDRNILAVHLSDRRAREVGLRKIGCGVENTIVFPVVPSEFQTVSDVLKILLESPLFKGLPADKIPALLDILLIKKYGFGDKVMKRGDSPDRFYMVLEGRAAVVVDNNEIANFGRGSFIGEIGVLNSVESGADITVVSLRGAKVVEIRRDDYLALVKGTKILEKLRRVREIKVRGVSEVLMSNRIFSGLTPEKADELFALMDVKTAQAGQILMKQGEEGDFAIIIADGEVNVIKDGTQIAVLKRGDVAGEIALLENVGRTATLISAATVQYYWISSRKFKNWLKDNPEVRIRLVHLAYERIGG